MPRRRSFVLALVAFLTTQTQTPSAASTTVSGAITTNTTWNLTGSPYVVTADVTVRNNAVLSIAPGVRVQFSPGTSLWIGSTSLGKGTLVANAAAGPPILFTSNQTVPARDDWEALQFWNAVGAQFDGDTYLSGSILRNCVIEYARQGLLLYNTSDSHAALVECTFRHLSSLALYIGAAAGATRVRYCQFTDIGGGGGCGTPGGVVTVDGNANLSFCAFTQLGGPCVSNRGGQCHIYGCTFTQVVGGCSSALEVLGPTWLEFSEIRENTNSPFTGCIHFRGAGPLVTDRVNIVNNTGYGVYNETSTNFSLPNVWWGTTSQAEIANLIYDCEDNPTRGCVFVDPILLQTVSVARGPFSPITAGRAWPNPLSKTVHLEFGLPRPGRATLSIYDVTGREVRTLVDDHLGGGPHSLVWDATDAGGRQVPSGLYVYLVLFEGHQIARGTLLRLR